MSILLDLAKNLAIERGVGSLQKRIDSYFGGDDDRTDDFVSQQKPGGLGSIIGRALAFALLGPIAGPIAFSAGRGILARRNQPLKMGLNTMDDIIDDPRGTFTAEGMQFADVQDTLGSSDSGTNIDYNTGNITDAATGANIGNVYDEVALTGGSDDSGSNGGGGGNMSASDFSDDTAGTPFRYGGLASLYR